MAFELKQLPGEPIIICTIFNPYSTKQDAPLIGAQLAEMLSAAKQQVYYIIDVRGISVSFGEVVQGLAMITRGEFTHLTYPHIRQIVAVTDNEMLRMAANALKQMQYGEHSVIVFSTPEEALDYVRGELARQS